MGAALSSTEPNKLAVAAISHVVHFDREAFCKLDEELFAVATESEDGSIAVTQARFNEAVALARIHPADKEIFDRLFVLYDRAGDGIIDAKEFSVGASILVKAKPKEKLVLALSLYDRAKEGRLMKVDLLKALQWLCKTSTFFGDKPPTQEALASLVDRVFVKINEDEPCDPSYMAYVEPILAHPLLDDFIKQSDDSPRLQQEPED